MTRLRRFQRFAVIAAAKAPVLVPGVAARRAQAGGGYDLSHNTIDGGGATFSTGGAFTLGGTAGQPDEGTLTGGTCDEILTAVNKALNGCE